MKNFSLKITFSIVSTIIALLMINLIASANRIFLPIMVHGENIISGPVISTPMPSATEREDSLSHNPNIAATAIVPAPPTEKSPPASPTQTATFAPGIPTHTPFPTVTLRSTSTPGPSPTNLQIGPGTSVPDDWTPPPLSP